MSVGERIETLRKQKNVSQNQLAQALSVSRQAVSKWENDQATPDSLKLIKLAEFLETDIEYLTTGRQVFPTRPPQVIKTVEVIETPVVQVVEKIVEREIEVPVPVVEYVEKPIVRKVIKTRFLRNPLEYAAIGIVSFVLGVLVGLVF